MRAVCCLLGWGLISLSIHQETSQARRVLSYTNELELKIDGLERQGYNMLGVNLAELADDEVRGGGDGGGDGPVSEPVVVWSSNLLSCVLVVG